MPNELIEVEEFCRSRCPSCYNTLVPRTSKTEQVVATVLEYVALAQGVDLEDEDDFDEFVESITEIVE